MEENASVSPRQCCKQHQNSYQHTLGVLAHARKALHWGIRGKHATGARTFRRAILSTGTRDLPNNCGSIVIRADIKFLTGLFNHTFGQTSSLRGRMPSAGGLLLTGAWEVSRWWNRETLPNTSWQYRWSSSNSSSISTASRGSLFWISCSPNTMSWSILLVFNVISCWKPYLGYKEGFQRKKISLRIHTMSVSDDEATENASKCHYCFVAHLALQFHQFLTRWQKFNMYLII